MVDTSEIKPIILSGHDDVIKWKHFPRNWPFVREIHRSPVNFPHKGQWRGALMFSLIYARINDWVNNREAGDLRRQHGHYDVIVMGRAMTRDCLYQYLYETTLPKISLSILGDHVADQTIGVKFEMGVNTQGIWLLNHDVYIVLYLKVQRVYEKMWTKKYSKTCSKLCCLLEWHINEKNDKFALCCAARIIFHWCL